MAIWTVGWSQERVRGVGGCSIYWWPEWGWVIAYCWGVGVTNAHGYESESEERV
jgi:hypothetical protein